MNARDAPWTALLALVTVTLLSGCANDRGETAAFCRVYDETNPALVAAMEPGAEFAALDDEAKKADLAARLDRIQDIYRQRRAVAPEDIRDDFQILIDGLELETKTQVSPDEASKQRAHEANQNIVRALSEECGIRLPPTTATP